MSAADPWASLVSSVRRYRAPDARFFKPVCLIAAIDLADEGSLDPEAVDADAVIHRFRTYVSLIFPSRAELGWRPLWHLSNDGLWTFYAGDHALTPDDFGSERKPGTKAILFSRFDRLAIDESLRTFWRAPEHRRPLRQAMLAMPANDDETCLPFVRQLVNPDLALRPNDWPPEADVIGTLRSTREQLDLFGDGTGVEVDDASALESDDIAEPFDPESIDVVTRSITVDLLLSRVSNRRIDLQPDFQRRWGIWDTQRQSRLIESLLLRIPLPVIYAAEDEDEKWEIVDGIQRLSTIARFIRPEIVGRAPLILSGLQYLEAYEGKGFDELSEKLKTRLKETELVVHVIRKGTPPEVKFNVFARINTGGIVLSPQELRHAITPGSARGVLETWAGSPEFVKATDGSVKPSRMDDRELVLRFLAFFILGLPAYRQADMDGYLIRAMKTINRLELAELDLTWAAFTRAMNTAHAIFDNDAFRKRFFPNAGRLPINKALFESVSVNLARLTESDLQTLIERQAAVRTEFMKLCGDRQFEAAISQGTGDVTKVKRRFASISDLFKKVLENA